MKRGTKSIKRLNASKLAKLKNKKQDVWIVKTNPGPHPKDDSIPLAVLIRDILGYAQTLKEVKKILANGHVMVDGKIVKDYRYPVGIMDIVSFPSQGTYFRMIINDKGKLVPMEIKKDESKQKIVQIKHKFVQPKGKLTVTLHDGKNIIIKENYLVGDSVVITVPELDVVKHIPIKEGSLCYVVKGKHAGSIGKVVEIKDLGMGQRQAKLETDDGMTFYTVKKYLFPVDDVKWVKVVG
ncbi:30S ribosomal protein S4e [Candidatus Micrarchaeota archaeon]|nr:30S ribosomal protein S4e [Candidatus Micrarchaeota archaeon]